MPFPMSDTTALLLRLEMDGKPKGVDLKDTWREIGETYANMDTVNNTFYDFHMLVRRYLALFLHTD